MADPRDEVRQPQGSARTADGDQRVHRMGSLFSVDRGRIRVDWVAKTLAKLHDLLYLALCQQKSQRCLGRASVRVLSRERSIS